jgi:hypothetical protein
MMSCITTSGTNENLGGLFEYNICHRRFQSQSELYTHINFEHEKRLPLAAAFHEPREPVALVT